VHLGLRRLVVALVVAATALWLGAFDGLGQAPVQDDARGVPTDAQLARVTRVVDGDTVRVAVTAASGPLRQGEYRIRLLEIDSPELDDGGGECGARAAKAYVRRRLPRGTTVWLETDRDEVDRFGRPLRYLWTADGELVNRTIVAHGHARAVLYMPNDRHWPIMRAAQDAARADRVGIWRRCAAG
jgi:micrococcal nuclease